MFDAASGERLDDIAFPKRWFHRVEERSGRLLLWDCAFLYCVKAPQSDPAAQGTLVVRQDLPDPDAIAALRTARDLEDMPAFEITALPVAPIVDADLAEWAGVEPRRLDGVMDWTPDFAHRSADKSRLYGGGTDCAATVRMGFSGEDLHVAIEVADDRHCASPSPGLWRSDGVTLLFGEPKNDEIDPLLLTVGLVNGLPRFELGTTAGTIAASDPAGQETAESPGPRRFVLPSLISGPAELPKLSQSIEIAARRDESAGRTFYEFRAPKVLFRYGPDFYWDLFINENDGQGRAGALQMASATWGVEETQIGSLRGAGPRVPGGEIGPRTKKKRGGSSTRPAR